MAVSKEHERALKKYKKEYFNPQHKELMRLSKEFNVWSGDYIEDMLFHMIQMFYDFYKNEDNHSFAFKLKQSKNGELVKDTTWLTILEECCKLAQKIRLEENNIEKTKLRNKFYKLIANNIDDWWD